LDGQSVASVSRKPGVSESQLHKWRKPRMDDGSEAEKELLALRKRLREVAMERDILKKAALIFGRGS
jgi:transposase-like protein